MKNKKMSAYIIVPTLFMLMAGVGIASAHGFGGMGGGFWQDDATPEDVAVRQETMFEHQAEMLGLSADIIKQGWAEGKNLSEIAEANGIDMDTVHAKMQAERQGQMKTHLQMLVDQGVITVAQMESRLQFMSTHTLGQGKGPGDGMRFRHGNDQ